MIIFICLSIVFSIQRRKQVITYPKDIVYQSGLYRSVMIFIKIEFPCFGTNIFHKTIIMCLVFLSPCCTMSDFIWDLNIPSTDVLWLMHHTPGLPWFYLGCSDFYNYFYNFHKGHKELSAFSNIYLWGLNNIKMSLNTY